MTTKDGPSGLTIIGFSGAVGGLGDDTIRLSTLGGIVSGGEGADSIFVRALSEGVNVIDGGNGIATDTLNFDLLGSAINLTLEPDSGPSLTWVDASQESIASDFEKVILTEFNDAVDLSP